MMHTALRLRVRSWEIPGPLRSHAVEEPLSECPPVVNAHKQTEIAAVGCHRCCARWMFCLTLKCMRSHSLHPPWLHILFPKC